VHAGLIKEVLNIIQKDKNFPDTASALAIGYKHALEFIMGGNFTEDNFVIFMKEFQAESRQYARRQLSWFRNQAVVPYFWCDMDSEERVREQLLELILEERGEFEKKAVMSQKCIGKDERKLLRMYQPQLQLFNPKLPAGFRKMTEILVEVSFMTNFLKQNKETEI